MKTRRSLSCLESVAKTDSSDTPSKRKSLSKVCKTPTSTKKEVNQVAASETRVKLNSNGNSESSVPPNVYSSPIVRVLRSRVVTSDNEDEVKSSRTPKRRLSRGSLKEDKSADTGNDQTSSKAEAKKSPESGKKRLSHQNLFSIVEMEENEDTAKGVASVEDKKATREIDSLSMSEENSSKDILMEENSSQTENVNKAKSQEKEVVRTPTSARKRTSLTSGSKETPSKAEGKRGKTPKSSGKKSSFESLFQAAGVNENKDKLNSTECVGSLKEDLIANTSSPTKTAEEFESEKSSVITSDNIERDGGSSDTNEEYVPKEGLLEEKSSETEFVDTKCESGNKERVKTPDSARRSSFITENKETPSKECVDYKSKSRDKETDSAKKRSSFIMDSNETPTKVEEKKGKTPKTSGKKFSLQGSFQVVGIDEDESRINPTESVDSHKDDVIKYASSSTESAEKPDSEKPSMIKIENIECDGDSSDKSEVCVPKDRLTENKSSETECVDSERKSDSRKVVKTPASARKSSFVITENKEAPSSVERKKKVKTPKSSEKRFSFQDSFKVVEMKEDEDSDDSQKGHLEPSTSTSESEGTDSFSVSKESGDVESEEMAIDTKKKDKMTGKRRSLTLRADDSDGSLMQRAMHMTSLAIQNEKKKQMKTPQKSEKMSIEATSEDESSGDSEEVQTEEITEQMDKVKENDSDSGSDSDDDIPESMSFECGKEQMNNAVKMAVEAIRREKERIKEQKRKRMEMIRTQKKEKEQRKMEKLKMLEMKMPKRLNEDIVNRLPDAPEIPTIKDGAAKKKKKNKMEVRDMEMKESKKKKITRFDDYIPLDVKAPTKFGIVPLDVMEKIPKSAAEKAAEFKRQALFGSRIQREPSKNLILYKQKIAAAFKSKEVNQQQRFKPY